LTCLSPARAPAGASVFRTPHLFNARLSMCRTDRSGSPDRYGSARSGVIAHGPSGGVSG